MLQAPEEWRRFKLPLVGRRGNPTKLQKNLLVTGPGCADTSDLEE